LDPASFTALTLGLLLALVVVGVPIMVSLGLACLTGLFILTGSMKIALSLVSATAFEALRDYVFAVIPLFVLMGELMARSGCARDLYTLMDRAFRRLPGHLAVATVAGNAIFAAVVGVSVASAAAFSRIAYPQMVSRGYDKQVALGCVAGSASLGMLIPPSVLMIVWGVLTELSIGKLFLAGFIPGLLAAVLFALYVIQLAVRHPERFGAGGTNAQNASDAPTTGLTRDEWIGGIGTSIVVLLALGGIWFGFFTPTEAAGVGALLALVLAFLKGLTLREFREVVLSSARIAAPILTLLIFAQMYSRMLAMGGVAGQVQQVMTALGLPAWGVLALMIVIWLVLGCFIDSVSIILLTVPIFAPIATQLGIHPIAFAIIGILVIEAGFVTPPFGLIVFTVKSSVPDPDVTLGQIFKGSTAYWVILVTLAWFIYFVPKTATFLPSLM
jgi:tripartite ATP-independent transporter DctM subunit